MTKILTSHVGSLPRTQKVVDFIFARENEQPFDQEKFDTKVIKISPVYVNRKKSWYNNSSVLNIAQLLTI